VTHHPHIRLSHASGSTAEIHPQGAHVTSWVPADGTEALFLSRTAKFEPGTAIRGGVPVIFPQFAGMGPLPKHGFARTQTWERVDAGEGTSVRLRLYDSEETRSIWPHEFLAEYAVELGDDWLLLTLEIENTGSQPIDFTAALHTYLRVADVRQAAVEGLHGIRYREKSAERVDEDGELAISGEVDRSYLNTPPELRVHDRANRRTFRLQSTGFADAVVWNPWAAATARLPDMEDGEYLEMICVEAAQVGTPIRLQPGERWTGMQRLQVVRG
jgi:glucose-6-phosphate 1-epimerase